MNFREIFRFEFAYQTRRPWPWLFFVVLVVISFLMTQDSGLADAMYEDFIINSPFAIAKTTVFGTLMWLLLAAPVAGEAAARDRATGMHSLVFTAPLSRLDYLGGRFLAAFTLNALILLGVQIGIALGVYGSNVAAGLIGPARPAGYLAAYGFITLPTAFVATALQFWFAVRSGRPMAAYAGSLLLIFMGFFVASLLLFRQSFGALVDPLGIRFVVEDIARSWTPIERNTRLLGLEGIVLWNRLLWTVVGLAALAVCYARFRFEHPALGGRRQWRWFGKSIGTADLDTPASARARQSAPAKGETVKTSANRQRSRTSGLALHVRQTLTITWDSFCTLAKSWTGLATLIGIPLLTVLVVIDQMEATGGRQLPITALVLRELTTALSNELSRWVIVPLLIIFFSGELVWREREAGVDEMNDTMPGSEWPPLIGKFLGLGLLLALFLLTLMAAGMAAQTMLDYQHFEPGLYLTVLLGLQLPEYLLFAVLAFAIHVAVNEKYIGYLVAIMAYVFIAVLASILGIQHPLLVYGAGPGWAYTGMRGFDPYLAPWAWFKLYWAAWALLFMVVARLLWIRGKEKGLAVRIEWARRRLTRPTAWTAVAAAGLILGLGGFVFYNTNIVNPYHTASESAERRAEYERRYGRFETAPQPRLTGTTLNVEIYPKRHAADITGSYRLLNNGSAPIDSIHLAIGPGGVETRAVTFDRPATLAVGDDAHGYRIYRLGQPLRPGDSLRLQFEVRLEPHGFRANGVDGAVSANGSAFMNGSLPAIGYQRGRALVNASDRRERGLPLRPVIASLSDTEGGEPAIRGGGVAFEAVMGTDEDQIAVAPGALRRTWTEHGRRYFQYSSDAPIGSEWSFFSAKYAVRDVTWKSPGGSGDSVAIRILHDPRHTLHLDRMERGARASLDYYTRQFGPYPYHQLTFVEHPGAPASGMHADAGMISYGEGFPFFVPKDEKGLDFPFAIVAHEMGHQWTLPYATVEGAPFLSEGLAWYSAMQVVKASRGAQELRRLLAFMRQPYPYQPIRRGEPLLRALDPYLSYRRGPFAMYALSEYVGVDKVNGALRHLIEKSDAAGAPLVTTLDLYRELSAVTPDSLKPLLHDLFEVNAYWQLETERATATETAAGTWQVTLGVTARKMVYDSTGVETEMPMDQWVEVGVYGPAEAGSAELDKPLYLQKQRVRSGKGTITVMVSGKPERAGIDPRHLLIDGTADGRDKLVKIGG